MYDRYSHYRWGGVRVVGDNRGEHTILIISYSILTKGKFPRENKNDINFLGVFCFLYNRISSTRTVHLFLRLSMTAINIPPSTRFN